MNRLRRTTLGMVPDTVVRPAPRDAIGTGIVHFGPGAFHRAHQAAYIDTLLDSDPRWGIAAVSLRSRGTIDTLAVQDGLYTLAIRDAASSYRIIDAHRRFLGPQDARATMALLADPAVALVTMTVTEKGYCLAADGTLDLDHPDIVADRRGDADPCSVIGWIVAGLARRHAAGIAPYVVMPCDNLADNGGKLHRALVAFAASSDPVLADWIDRTVRVPGTMVDSITPASDEPLYDDVAGVLGLEDRGAVQREAFAQWVIEDVGDIGPDLAAAGATLTTDVAGYERAKLRMLNGAHSTLAYAGLLRGHDSVAAAMRDPALADFVEAMIRREIIPTVGIVPGLDLDRYADDVLARFRNPAIVHRLDQIAQDGSQKLPYRLGDTLAAQRAAGVMPHRVVAALGCWAAFVLARLHAGTPVIDPAAATLAAAADGATPADFVVALARQDCGLSWTMLDDAALIEALRRAADAAASARWGVLGIGS